MKQRTKHKNTQKGFAHVGVVIAVIAVVAALAVGGWYVWDKNKEEKKTSDSTSQNNQEEQKQSDPSEGGKYLVIKEWGVRFELPEELRSGIEYGIFSPIAGDQIANFAITEINKLPQSNCELTDVEASEGSGKSGGVVNIHKTRKAPEEFSKDIAVSYDSSNSVDNNWYYVFSMRDSCFDAADAEFARLMAKIELLADAGGRLESIQE